MVCSAPFWVFLLSTTSKSTLPFKLLFFINRHVWTHAVAPEVSQQNSRGPWRRRWEQLNKQKNIVFRHSTASGFNSQRSCSMCEKHIIRFLASWWKLWSILQVSPRRSHLFLLQRKMKKPWKARAFRSCCANWECEHLQMNRCVSVIFHH